MDTAWVNNYIGLPYSNRGRSRDGSDCWGLVYMVEKEVFGIELPDLLSEYRSADNIDETSEVIAMQKAMIPADKVEVPTTGDIVLIAYRGVVCHTGIYVEPNMILHTERGKASVLEKLTRLSYRARVEGFYRVSQSLRIT